MKLHHSLFLILFGLLFTLTPARAEELEKTMRQFVEKDKELNRAYQELQGKLPVEQFNTLREEQRNWLHYRDGMSEWQAQGEAVDTSPEYWEMRAAITAERCEWLQAWNQRDNRRGWTGEYIDSHGGILRIAEDKGQLHFMVHVVRGPTFHLGSIGGVLNIAGAKASYEVRPDPEEKLTRITITPLGDGSGRLHLEGENTQWFHGARAYFDGDYIWTGELTKEGRKAVLEGEPE